MGLQTYNDWDEDKPMSENAKLITSSQLRELLGIPLNEKLKNQYDTRDGKWLKLGSNYKFVPDPAPVDQSDRTYSEVLGASDPEIASDESFELQTVANAKLIDLPNASLVDVTVDRAGKLWVNVDGKCLLRIGQCNNVVFDDPISGYRSVHGFNEDKSSVEVKSFAPDTNSVNPWHPISNKVDLKTLGKLAEELGELSAAVARCIIQGQNAKEPVTGKPNIVWLTEEIADVQASIDLVKERFFIADHIVSDRAERKKKQLREWHNKA